VRRERLSKKINKRGAIISISILVIHLSFQKKRDIFTFPSTKMTLALAEKGSWSNVHELSVDVLCSHKAHNHFMPGAPFKIYMFFLKKEAYADFEYPIAIHCRCTYQSTPGHSMGWA
jgi:hypothetical protein